MTIGFAIDTGVIVGVFRLGRFILARRIGRPLAERGRTRTVITGASVTMAVLMVAWAVDSLTRGNGYAMGGIVITYMSAVALSPWSVFDVLDR